MVTSSESKNCFIVIGKLSDSDMNTEYTSDFTI